MELNPKSTESIIEVNLFWKLNLTNCHISYLTAIVAIGKRFTFTRKTQGEETEEAGDALQLQLAT